MRRGPRLADNYTVMSNRVLNDENLSFRARGILVWLLSKPADWSIRSEAIAAQSPSEGRTAVRTAMRELEEQGYLVREKIQNELGQWATIQTVYEEPATSGNPHPEPKTRKSNPGQPRDGRTGAFTKSGSLSTETNNNTSQADTSRATLAGVTVSLSEDARKELERLDTNYALLIKACADAGLPGSFEHVKPEQKAQILELIDRHGIQALADRAKSMHRDDNPTLYAQGWIRLWKAMSSGSGTAQSTAIPYCGGCVNGWIENEDRDPIARCECRGVA
ncbi:hypothetical protein BO226_19120 [Rhodococcus sp. 2G]|nr:hypothetical protein BO226_18785 [Rhodococcus sp. 2G]APE12398.1 hypothetical protein BO226_19120 [Rhodococcus sp. 2G]